MKEADPRAWQRALRGRVLIAAALGLLSKAILVTIPFVLLLLDRRGEKGSTMNTMTVSRMACSPSREPVTRSAAR